MPFEIEQKYRISNPSKIRKILKRLKAWKIKSGFEQNELFDLKSRRLRRRKSVLRLRRFAKEGKLTFKGPKMKGKYKKRLEIETKVDYENTKKILALTGFRIVARYSKTREEYKVGSSIITLDHLEKDGWFLEIESSPKQIESLARKLGLEKKDIEPRTYLEILSK